MSTIIRPELSEKNKYWIDRHRYYELKHFCLQYPMWKKCYISIDGLNTSHTESIVNSRMGHYSDPTAKHAIAKSFYSERIALLEQIALETDVELGDYVLRGVTEGYSYDGLRMKYNIPCCKDIYYELYRRFFWLLSNTRN